MDAFEDYAFDVRGFLHIKAALSEPEILRARASANDGTALDFLAQTEPAASRAALFCKGRGGGPAGGTPKLGAVPRLIDGEHNPVLRGGVGRDRSVAYFNRQGSRVVQSLRALWALDDDNSQRFVLVPCSHRSSLEAPPQCVTGEDDLGARAMPLFFRPVLRAGDLLLYSPALLHSIEAIATSSSTSTGRLVGCEYLTNSVAPFAERADLAALKNFEGELSPMLEAILLFDQQREQADKATQHAREPVPTVLSDGKRTWLGSPDNVRDDHPRVLVPATDAGQQQETHRLIDPGEAFCWDLNGYLIIRQLMSPELLAAAHAAIDSQREQLSEARDLSRQQADKAAAEHQGSRKGNQPSPAGGRWQDGSPHSELLSGYPRMQVYNLLSLPLPHCLPFREMAAHPAIVQRLNWVQGPGFKLNTLGFSIVSEQGCGGQSLHANGTPLWGAVNAFDLHDGRFSAGSVNVAWQLHDVDCAEDGGFCVRAVVSTDRVDSLAGAPQRISLACTQQNSWIRI